MSVEAILMMLEGVKTNGANKWVALCPVHAHRARIPTRDRKAPTNTY